MTHFEEQAVMDQLFADSYKHGGGRPREMARFIIGELSDDGSGSPWVADRLEEWATQGAMHAARGWLQRQKVSKSEMETNSPPMQLMQSVERVVGQKLVESHYEDIRLWDVKDAEAKVQEYTNRKRHASDLVVQWTEIRDYCTKHDCLVGQAMTALDIRPVGVEAA